MTGWQNYKTARGSAALTCRLQSGLWQRILGSVGIPFTFNLFSLFRKEGEQYAYENTMLSVCKYVCLWLWLCLFVFPYFNFWASWLGFTKLVTDVMPLKATQRLHCNFLHWVKIICQQSEQTLNKRFCFMTRVKGKGPRRYCGLVRGPHV